MQSLSHFLLDFSVLALCVRQQRPQWGLLSSADTVVSPCDVQRFPVDKTRCDLASCAFVNFLHGRAGNIHLRGTLLMGLLLQVNQPNGLVLVQRQQDRLGILAPVGAEGINLWYTANPLAPWRSWHGCTPFCFRYMPIIALWEGKSNILFKSCCNFRHHIDTD